jgi:hypothetical protein
VAGEGGGGDVEGVREEAAVIKMIEDGALEIRVGGGGEAGVVLGVDGLLLGVDGVDELLDEDLRLGDEGLLDRVLDRLDQRVEDRPS